MSQSVWTTVETVTWKVHHGRVVRLLDNHSVLVLLDDNTARSVECSLLETADGQRLSLECDDLVLISLLESCEGRGWVIGRTHTARPLSSLVETDPSNDRAAGGKKVPDTLVLKAKHELMLRVGDGSITIREDGKILIKGKDLVSHAQRMNRIKGGSVSIN